MGIQAYSIGYTRLEAASPKRVGRIHGKLGQEYTWQFVYDFSWKPEDQLEETVIWEWRFQVFTLRGVMVYQASADMQPLLRAHSDLRHVRHQADYQAQLFLEEHLHLKLDAGSSPRHRIPGRTVTESGSAEPSSHPSA